MTWVPRSLSVVIFSSSTAAADEGLTREVYGLLRVLPAGSQGQGDFPAVWAAPGHDHISHNAQKHFHYQLPQPTPSLLSLSLSVFSLLAPPTPFAFFLHFSFLFLPSPLPAFWRYPPTYWLKPVPFDLMCMSTSCPVSGGQRSAQLMLQLEILFVCFKNKPYLGSEETHECIVLFSQKACRIMKFNSLDGIWSLDFCMVSWDMQIKMQVSVTLL